MLTLPGYDDEAYLWYEEQDDGDIYNFTQTDIPESLAGRNLASALARTACEYARSNDIKIVPTCTHVANYLLQNPDEIDVVAYQ